MIEPPELMPVFIHGCNRAKVGLQPALHGHLAARSITGLSRKSLERICTMSVAADSSFRLALAEHLKLVSGRSWEVLPGS